jgi:hypothetical protein
MAQTQHHPVLQEVHEQCGGGGWRGGGVEEQLLEQPLP